MTTLRMPSCLQMEAQGHKAACRYVAGGSPSHSSITSTKLFSETQAPRNWTRFLQHATVYHGQCSMSCLGSHGHCSLHMSGRCEPCAAGAERPGCGGQPVIVQMSEQCDLLQHLKCVRLRLA